MQPDAFLDGRFAADDEARVGCHQGQRQINVVLYDLVVELAVELLVPRVAILLHDDDFRVGALVFIVLVNPCTDNDRHEENNCFEADADQDGLRRFGFEELKDVGYQYVDYQYP